MKLLWTEQHTPAEVLLVRNKGGSTAKLFVSFIHVTNRIAAKQSRNELNLFTVKHRDTQAYLINII